MRKLIDFKSLVSDIQEYADKHCDGNFSFAVRQLVARQLITVTLEEKQQ